MYFFNKPTRLKLANSMTQCDASMELPNPETLIAQIADAFSRISKPRITLRVARGMDDHHPNAGQLARQDRHYSHWDEIPEADLEMYGDVFLWLDAEAFRFYLPAFMSHALRKAQLEDLAWLDSVFSRDTFRPEFFTPFTLSQKQAVLAFLTAVLASVKDDYHLDWWNYPWDPNWDEDAPKESLWETIGHGWTHLKNEIPKTGTQ